MSPAPLAPGRPRPAVGHAGLDPDALAALGHDWSQVADPDAPAEPPLTVHLPRSTEDVVRVLRAARATGERVVVRAAAHSSNGLVTNRAGTVLITTGLDRVLAIDATVDGGGGTVRVQAGAAVCAVDAALAERGLGLEVVPDHADITVGGFASVGGLSAASLHVGMFVDAVLELTYVDWEGTVRRCDRGATEGDLLRVLGGLGRYGVLTEVVLRVVPADRDRRVLRNDRRRFLRADTWAAAAGALFSAPGSAAFARASWLDLPGVGPGVGVLSAYRPADRSGPGLLRAQVAYGVLRGLGTASVRLPGGLGVAVKQVATAGLMLAPRYARERDVQRFSDGVLDWTVGDPSRLLVALTPVERLPEVFAGMRGAALRLRRDTGALTVVSTHLKGIRSAYLTGGHPDRVWVEVLLVVGIDRARMTPALLSRLVSEIDGVCLRAGAFRYQHTATTTGPDAGRLDPHARYAGGGEHSPRRTASVALPAPRVSSPSHREASRD